MSIFYDDYLHGKQRQQQRNRWCMPISTTNTAGEIFLFARCLLSRKFVPRRRGDETGPAADLHAQAQGQNDGPQR